MNQFLPIQSKRSPPGPQGHWLVGNLPEFGRDLLGFLSRCAREHGTIVKFRLAGWTAYLLNDPEHIEYILLSHHRRFIKHRFFWRHVTAIFGQGLLTSEGDFWHHQRRLAAPAFHHQRIAAYGQVMVRCAEQRLADWQEGEILDIHHEMMRLTGAIVAQTLFHTEFSADMEEILHAFDLLTKEIASRFRRPFKLPDWVPTPGNHRYRAGVRRLDRLVYRIIQEHRHHPRNPADLLSLLMRARDEEGRGMSDKQLRDEVVTLFLAGYETTAITLSWAWYALSQHRASEARLLTELKQVLQGRSPTVDDLSRLPYTEMIIKESLRLYPPAYVIGRQALQACTIGGYTIPAGATLFISPWVLQRDPRYFEEPQEFRPERWAAEFETRLPRYVYLPFGGGPRICIGHRFAMMEAMLLLATIAQRFRFTWQSQYPATPFPSITLRAQDRMWMKVVGHTAYSCSRYEGINLPLDARLFD